MIILSSVQLLCFQPEEYSHVNFVALNLQHKFRHLLVGDNASICVLYNRSYISFDCPTSS